jgi:hypothetical protein
MIVRKIALVFLAALVLLCGMVLGCASVTSAPPTDDLEMATVMTDEVALEFHAKNGHIYHVKAYAPSVYDLEMATLLAAENGHYEIVRYLCDLHSLRNQEEPPYGNMARPFEKAFFMIAFEVSNLEVPRPGTRGMTRQDWAMLIRLPELEGFNPTLLLHRHAEDGLHLLPGLKDGECELSMLEWAVYEGCDPLVIKLLVDKLPETDMGSVVRKGALSMLDRFGDKYDSEMAAQVRVLLASTPVPDENRD